MTEYNLMSLDGIQMPHSIEAEQAVLGSILVEPSCISQAAVYLPNSEAFFQPQHREIYKAMQYLEDTNQKIDPLVVLNQLVEHDVFDAASGRKYLLDLAQMVPSTENVETYAKIIREKFYIRTLITVSSETIESAVSQEFSADELLNNAEQRIYDIRQGKASNAASKLYDVIVGQVYDTLKKLTGEDRDLYKGFTTGFKDLDNVLSGLNRSDLIIIGARPAMGKTSFALNLARNVALIGKRKTLFFSLEMTKEQLATRVLGTESGVSSHKMRSGQLTPDEWKSIGMATGVLNGCDLYFDDTASITVPEMKAKTRRLGGVECVIIDYLGLIHGATKAENRVNEVSEITRSLKNMAKDLNIPIICCAQLSRGTEARGKSHKPQLADLRESGSIEQDADIVMMLYRENYYAAEKDDKNQQEPPEGASQEDINKVSVIVAKNRHGSTGEIEFIWDGEHTRFIQIEKVHDEE